MLNHMMQSWLYDWVLWASLAAGVGVSGLVFVAGRSFRVVRRPGTSSMPREEDLPWEDLLLVLKARYAEGGKEELSSDELMEELLAKLPNRIGAPDTHWAPPGSERRTSKRRWSNPVEVTLVSPFHEKPIHGLVINRSTGGLAIMTDIEFAADTVLAVRSVDAPKGNPYVSITIRHARRVGNLWMIGCQYDEDVPWDVKVWFG